MFGLHPEEYPDNYDSLSVEDKERILWIYTFVSQENPRLAEEYLTALREECNIYIEEGWAGHYKPFLATRADAEQQLEFYWKCAEVD